MNQPSSSSADSLTAPSCLGTPSHVPLQRRAIIITILPGSGTNCMVPSGRDFALNRFVVPISYVNLHRPKMEVLDLELVDIERQLRNLAKQRGLDKHSKETADGIKLIHEKRLNDDSDVVQSLMQVNEYSLQCRHTCLSSSPSAAANTGTPEQSSEASYEQFALGRGRKVRLTCLFVICTLIHVRRLSRTRQTVLFFWIVYAFIGRKRMAIDSPRASDAPSTRGGLLCMLIERKWFSF